MSDWAEATIRGLRVGERKFHVLFTYIKGSQDEAYGASFCVSFVKSMFIAKSYIIKVKSLICGEIVNCTKYQFFLGPVY